MHLLLEHANSAPAAQVPPAHRQDRRGHLWSAWASVHLLVHVRHSRLKQDVTGSHLLVWLQVREARGLGQPSTEARP